MRCDGSDLEMVILLVRIEDTHFKNQQQKKKEH